MQFMIETYWDDASSVTLMMAIRGLGFAKFGVILEPEVNRLISGPRAQSQLLLSSA